MIFISTYFDFNIFKLVQMPIFFHWPPFKVNIKDTISAIQLKLIF